MRRKKNTDDSGYPTLDEREKEVDNIEYDTDEWSGFKELKCPWVIVVREHWRDHREIGDQHTRARLDGTNEVVFRFYTYQETTARRWFECMPEFIARSYPYSENYYSATLSHNRTRVDVMYLKGGRSYANRREEAENEYDIRLAGRERNVSGRTGDTEPTPIQDDKQQGTQS